MIVDESKDISNLESLSRIIPKSLFKVLPSLINIGVLLFVFILFDGWYRSLTEINLDDFNEIMLATSPTQFFKGSIILFLPVILIVVLMIWGRKHLFIKWKDISGGTELRWVIGVCIIALSWIHISFPFNYFLNESILIERFLVLTLTLLTIWRPFFLILYLFFPIIFHFGEPLMVNNWSVTELPIRILTLFGAQLIYWLLFHKHKWNINAFLFIFICVIAGNYFPAGISKLKMGWLSNDNLYLLLSNMYADGWLNILSEDVLSEVTQFLSKYNLLLKIGCLVFEFGCILILTKKTWSIRFFLLGFLTFHALVFAMTGILFWPWIAFEIVLLNILRRKSTFKSEINKFGVWHILLSVMLIFTSTIWLKPSVYAWHDSPVNYSYYFKVQDVTGQTFNLPVQYFWPKHYQQAWTNGFHFIHDKPTLNIVWGVSFNEEEVNKLMTFKNAEDVIAYEMANGKSLYQPELAAEFKRYMIDFIKDKDYKLTLNPWFRVFSAPPQRLVFSEENLYDGKYDIVKIHIYQRLSSFNGTDYKELRKQKVMTIDIPK
ncbi:hypothetical protein [Winogradskyella sp. R77965]|uniref:hypothetical protein n=1 Tax=Winogradskyella sp. R77965 TaxID=3093872 RepID=UPI0037DDAC82